MKANIMHGDHRLFWKITWQRTPRQPQYFHRTLVQLVRQTHLCPTKWQRPLDAIFIPIFRQLLESAGQNVIRIQHPRIVIVGGELF